MTFRTLPFEHPAAAETRRRGNALTPAERQARRRAMVLGGISGHLDAAEAALQLLDHEVLLRTEEADLAMESLRTHLAQIRDLLPKPKAG